VSSSFSSAKNTPSATNFRFLEICDEAMICHRAAPKPHQPMTAAGVYRAPSTPAQRTQRRKTRWGRRFSPAALTKRPLFPTVLNESTVGGERQGLLTEQEDQPDWHTRKVAVLRTSGGAAVRRMPRTNAMGCATRGVAVVFTLLLIGGISMVRFAPPPFQVAPSPGREPTSLKYHLSSAVVGATGGGVRGGACVCGRHGP
jgi:hypothetical protein